MAIYGLSGHVAGTSAFPPIADLRVSMSAFAPIAGADLPGGVADGPFLTRRRLRSVQVSRYLGARKLLIRRLQIFKIEELRHSRSGVLGASLAQLAALALYRSRRCVGVGTVR